MKKGWFIILSLLFILIVAGAIALVVVPAPKTPAAASLNDLITVTSPLPNSTIGSTTITITGKARGNWYFEASAPVELKDASGAVIAQSHIEATSDWMTTDFVPFSATLSFPPQLAGSTGTLVLKNDNPSGDPAKQKELDIPIKF